MRTHIINARPTRVIVLTLCVCLEFAAVYTPNMTYHYTFRLFLVVKRFRILHVVEHILYEVHLCAESAIIFPRSSLATAISSGTATCIDSCFVLMNRIFNTANVA